MINELTIGINESYYNMKCAKVVKRGSRVVRLSTLNPVQGNNIKFVERKTISKKM